MKCTNSRDISRYFRFEDYLIIPRCLLSLIRNKVNFNYYHWRKQATSNFYKFSKLSAKVLLKTSTEIRVFFVLIHKLRTDANYHQESKPPSSLTDMSCSMYRTITQWGPVTMCLWEVGSAWASSSHLWQGDPLSGWR